MKNYFETKLTNFVNAFTDDCSFYQGPREFTLKTECLMEFGTLEPYFDINLNKEKLEDPSANDPDFMCFLNSVTNIGDYYEVTYIIDTTLKTW